MNYKIATVVLSAILAYDTVVSLENRRRFARLLKSRDNAMETNHYLASLLDQQGYNLTDFDKTALLTMNDR